MEITHPYLRMAAGALLAAGLASACSGGSSGTAATTPPDPDPEPPAPTETRMPEDCTDASPTCTVTSGTTTTVTTNMADATAMTNTRTVTVSGTMRTITVTSTVPANNNRVMSVETQTCTGGANCRRTMLVETDYTGTSPVTTTTRYNAAGQVVSVMVGDAAATTTMYSSSGGGRTETTVTSAGTRVQTFSVYSGGTATSTVFTSTDGLTVTTMDGAMRVETVYGSRADAENGRNPVSRMAGTALANSDTGFALGTTVVRTEYYRDAAAVGGRTLVAATFNVAIPMAGGTATTPEPASRTYITSTDAQGRELKRETYAVDSNNREGRVTVEVTTVHPAAGAEMPMTVATTVERNAANAATKTTEVTTDGTTRVVTTVVRNGDNTAPIVTTVVRNPRADDGSTTVATTGGPGAGAGDPANGVRVSVRTLSDGTEVTTTSTPGAAPEDPRVVTMVVTTDENGVETLRVTPAAGGSTETRVATAYRPDGGSTVTTTTWTRAADAEDDAPLTQSGVTVVVTRDAMQRETLSVTTNSEGMETDRRVTVYAADGSSTATRTFSGGTGDMLMDVNIVKRDAPGMGQTVGDITDDIVIHPGVQSHGMVNDEQYMMIQEGMAMRTGARTVMSKALLHLNYSGDDAFNAFVRATDRSDTVSDGMNVEVELITTRPTCAASSCTYDNLAYQVEPSTVPEIRIFKADGELVAPDVLAVGGASTAVGWNSGVFPNPPAGNFWRSFGESTWDNNAGGREGPAGRAVMLRLLTDLLNVGGAGVTAEYTAPESTTLPHTVAANVEKLRPAVEVGRAAATALERGTFTDLKTTGLPDGVTGIGRQMKRVDSYLRLGGSRDTDPMNDVVVPVTVENYFGWMANSMFTVRRVTAQGVAGERYDWVSGVDAPDATDEVRAYLAMASGTPSIRPEERRAEGMTDPGTWTGSMIGVGSIQGERYRGRAKVEVDFDTNGVTTAFDQIRLATDFDADLTNQNLLRITNVHPTLRDGISFQSAGITSAGSFTSSMLMGGAVMGEGVRRNNINVAPVSDLSGQFYGDADNPAAEVAGTFTAYGLALGKTGEEATPGYRGDLVGAFGAARDAMEEVEDN